jgi:arginyl-tRNA synthetase
VIEKATEMTKERGHLEGMTAEEREKLFHQIGMGGLKYYLLKVDPKKRMLFNPEESIELNGNTGPFIQYAHARIQSLMSKSQFSDWNTSINATDVLPLELEIIKMLNDFPAILKESADLLSPALIANYAYELVKTYNHFYQTVSILNETDEQKKKLRLILSANVAKVIRQSIELLGFEAPNRM